MKIENKLYIVITAVTTLCIFISAQIAGATDINLSGPSSVASGFNASTPGSAPVYRYRIVNTFPHDPSAFTQGLAFEHDILYEGTGIRGRSSLSAVNIETGKILKQYALPQRFFGEGITIFGDNLAQLTWRSRIGFIYDKNSFRLLRTFYYPTEGWGITYDGTSLIMSNGTETLIFLDPVTFREIRTLDVYDGEKPVTSLNELEFVKEEIYANVWRSNRIAIISPDTGRVTGWIDLEDISIRSGGDKTTKTLNGIAYDSRGDRLFVTGKLWPDIYEIRIVRSD